MDIFLLFIIFRLLWIFFYNITILVFGVDIRKEEPEALHQAAINRNTDLAEKLLSEHIFLQRV